MKKNILLNIWTGFFYGRLIITASSVLAWQYGYWSHPRCCWHWFIFLIEDICKERGAHTWLHTFSLSSSYEAVRSLYISSGGKGRKTTRRVEDTEGQIKWMRGAKNWHCKRMETNKGPDCKQEGKDRAQQGRANAGVRVWQTGRGGGGGKRGVAGVGEMWVESKPPSSPDSSVKDIVLKRWIACALSAKACPRQWHHHHQTSKDTRREPQIHAWIFYSLLFIHLFIILLSLRLSLWIDTDNEVFILKNLIKTK